MNHSETITTGFGAVAGAPGIGEYVDWDCISHILWWPSSTRWSGKSIVPNVGPELVVNGDMELGPLNSDPTSWHHGGSCTFQNSTTFVWGDNRSPKWHCAAAAGLVYVYTDQNINASTAGSYTLRFAARSVTSGVTVQALLRTPGYVTMMVQDFSIPNDSVWCEYSYTANLLATSANAWLTFLMSSGPAMDVYIDDVSIRRSL
jgi:hypothetical protein